MGKVREVIRGRKTNNDDRVDVLTAQTLVLTTITQPFRRTGVIPLPG